MRTKLATTSGSILILLWTATAAPQVFRDLPRFEALVTSNVTTAKPVGPWIYGNFIELGFGRQVDGMWSEMLWNRSFEEVTPLKSVVWDWLERKPTDDLTGEPWWHSGYEESPWALAPSNPDAALAFESSWGFRHGARAAIVTNRSPDRWAVLAQDGLRLARDRTYRFSGWFATAGETALPVSKNPVKVKVGLYPEKDFAKPLAEKELTVGSGAFAELTADLPSGIFEGRASFVVSVEPGKGVRIDGLSLQPADNIRGWRRDVIDALKTIKPPIIRFPGGCFASFSDWRDGVGPRIDRRPRESAYWGGLENNDVGVAELVDLCREVGAEPFYCLNVLTGSPAEAADLVAYCNSGPETPLGGLRKGHGFEKPFGIRYWELDNEAYRRFGAAEYAERCVAFAKAIKAVDPEAKLVMIGYWRYNDELARMLEIAGEWVDGVTDRALDERSLRKDLETIGAYNKARQRSLFLCNTEWLAPQTVKEVLPGAVLAAGEELSGTLQNKQVRWGYAMTAAAQLLLFQRLGGDFLFANFNNLANTWGQNVIECAKEAVWTSAAGRLFELVTPSPAALPLEHKVVAANPNVLFQAAWDKDKKSLVLEVLNFGRETVQSAFDLKALNFRYREVRMSRLWADSLQAMNSLGNPNGIRRNDDVERGGGGARFTTELPPCSVTLIILSSVMTMGDQKRIER